MGAKCRARYRQANSVSRNARVIFVERHIRGKMIANSLILFGAGSMVVGRGVSGGLLALAIYAGHHRLVPRGPEVQRSRGPSGLVRKKASDGELEEVDVCFLGSPSCHMSVGQN